jgi:hypothetical protein
VNEFVPLEATYRDTELVYSVPHEHVASSSKVDVVALVPIKVDSTFVEQIQNEEEANSVELKVMDQQAGRAPRHCEDVLDYPTKYNILMIYVYTWCLPRQLQRP